MAGRCLPADKVGENVATTGVVNGGNTQIMRLQKEKTLTCLVSDK